MKHRVLVAEDDPGARASLDALLKRGGFAVDVALDGEDAVRIAAARTPDLVITDLKMPRLDGMELLAHLRATYRHVPVIVLTAYGDIPAAVSAMRAGAADFLSKPIDFQVLSMTLARALEHQALRKDAEALRREIEERDGEGLHGINGKSEVMTSVFQAVRDVAPSKATVLITGESGTGKGELARAIHATSPRASGPFIPLHCSALPESLLESELFGHERGAFTGADRRRVGRFEQAHRGTLFLDEIGEIPPLTQIKLLRVLQEKTIERIGSNEPIAVDVRVIAATHRDLDAAVRAGAFREDLYYRLNVVHVEMPPLRSRGGDVLSLALHFLRRFAADNQKSVEGFTTAAQTKLLHYRWPGNVRELENAVERAVVMADGAEIDAGDLPLPSDLLSGAALPIPGSTLAEIERFAIQSTLRATDGSTSRAAGLLDVSVRMIQYRLREYEREAAGEKPAAGAREDEDE